MEKHKFCFKIYLKISPLQVSDPTGKYALKVEGVNEQIQALFLAFHYLMTNIKFEISRKLK